MIYTAINKNGKYFHMVANETILTTADKADAFECTDACDAANLVECLADSDPDGDWKVTTLRKKNYHENYADGQRESDGGLTESDYQ